MEIKFLPAVIFNLGQLHWNRVMKQDKFDKEGQKKIKNHKITPTKTNQQNPPPT